MSWFGYFKTYADEGGRGVGTENAGIAAEVVQGWFGTGVCIGGSYLQYCCSPLSAHFCKMLVRKMGSVFVKQTFYQAWALGNVLQQKVEVLQGSRVFIYVVVGELEERRMNEDMFNSRCDTEPIVGWLF